jgi:hypothetical protein
MICTGVLETEHDRFRYVLHGVIAMTTLFALCDVFVTSPTINETRSRARVGLPGLNFVDLNWDKKAPLFHGWPAVP